MGFRLTILGCASSGGVPRLGAGWGACDPSDPRNRRRRCSVLIERTGDAGKSFVLVDTSPDLREQLLSSPVSHLDAVLFTHEHADHTHGIDDLRALVIHSRRKIPIHADAATLALLKLRFGYCFASPPGSDYPPILTANELMPGRAFGIDGAGGRIDILPIRLIHGSIEALAFRFGPVAYAPDVSYVPEDGIEAFEGLDCLIIDALRYKPHPTHFSVSDALAFIERVKPKRAILTNLHGDLDYETLKRELPPFIEPAYDNLDVLFS